MIKLSNRVDKLEKQVLENTSQIKTLWTEIKELKKNILGQLKEINSKLDNKKYTWFDKISYGLSGGFILLLISMIFYS